MSASRSDEMKQSFVAVAATNASGTELATWAEEVEEEWAELMAEKWRVDSFVERKTIVRKFLETLGKFLTFKHPERTPLNRREATMMAIEMENSVEDLMIMLNYIDSNKSDPTQGKVEIRQVEQLKIISWDLGMLSPHYMGSRAEAGADLISKEDFDVIFLQELNPWVLQYLRCRLSKNYEFFLGRTQHESPLKDFTATLIRKDTLTCSSNKIIYFKNTGEHRALLKTEVMIGNTKLCLLNTHLESLLGNSQYRRQQLQKCLNMCSSHSSDSYIIFSGSLNIREWEVEKLNWPKNLIDLWENFGDAKNKFTWTFRINKKFTALPTKSRKDKPPPQQRFSRMYFRIAASDLLKPTSFCLLGKELIVQERGYYVSDHWALSSQFAVSRECYEEQRAVNELYLTEEEDEADNVHKAKPVLQETVKDNWDDSD